MREYDVALQPGVTATGVVQAVDRAAREAGLTQVSKGKLAKYPGSTHWHFKMGCIAGTLELTYWPQQSRLWFSTHDNRHAPWIDEHIERLKLDIERWQLAAGREVHA
jgi:hypothetical protein